MDGGTEGRTDEWMNQWMGGWVCGWMGRRFWHATHDCVAPCVDIILHRGRFWAKSAASGSVRWMGGWTELSTKKVVTCCRRRTRSSLLRTKPSQTNVMSCLVSCWSVLSARNWSSSRTNCDAFTASWRCDDDVDDTRPPPAPAAAATAGGLLTSDTNVSQLHRVSKNCIFIFGRTSSNFHQF